MENKCMYCKQETDKPIEKNCEVCGEKFDSYHHYSQILLHRCDGFERFCLACKEKMRVVDWWGHHRTDPTKEKLEKEVRQLLKKLGSQK